MKKNINTLALILGMLILSVMTNSCKKASSENGEYFVKFKAGNNNINYSNQAGLYYTATQSGNSHFIIISGFNNASSNISLQVYSNAAVTTGTYSSYSVGSGIPLGVIIGYLDAGSGELFNTAGAVTDAIITITEINNTHVKGSFSGTVKKSGQADIVISSGEFYVKKIN
jgi:hypothetical protein